MSWPDVDAILAAATSGRDAFEDAELREATPSRDARDDLVVARGDSAVVLAMDVPGRRIALRVFLKDRADRDRRYEAVARYLERHKLDALVPFTYLKRGLRVGDRVLPAMKMTWVDGEPLDARVIRLLDDPPAMRALAHQFFATMGELARHNVAHGDLQPSNILVTPQGLRLLDYDTTFAPGLETLGAAEPGHPDLQHPRRARLDFGPTIDHFSAWSIHVSLLALSLDPTLWAKFGAEGRLLFRREDFTHPESSHLLQALRALPRGELLVERILEALASDPLGVPPLDELPLPPPTPPRAEQPAVAAEPRSEPAPQAAPDAVALAPSPPGPRALDTPLKLERASLVALGGAMGLGVFFGVARATPWPVIAGVAAAEVAVWLGYLAAAHATHPAVRERRAALGRLGEAQDALMRAERQLAEAPSEPLPRAGLVDDPRAREAARQESDELAALEREAAEALEAIQANREAIDAQEAAALSDARRESLGPAIDAALTAHPIAAAPLPMPPAATRALLAAGVRTAADVRPGIAGVDEAALAPLLSWRRQLEDRAVATMPGGIAPDLESRVRARFSLARSALDAQEAQVTDEARSREEVIRQKHRAELARAASDADQAERAARSSRADVEAQRAQLAKKIEDRRRELAWAQEEVAAFDDVRFRRFLARVLSGA